MCGIFGLLGDISHHFNPQHISSLSHRGPDDEGFFVCDASKLVLGHTRLSIIDLSSQGHQPMSDEEGRFIIVFNGEIYNYLELQHDLQFKGYKFKSNSDTEVVLNAFREHGTACFAMLRGMFALAIYDKQNEEIVLARDRWGIKPLLYARTDRGLVFSSEIKALFSSEYIDKRIDPVALSELLAFGAVRQPRTIIDSLFQLLPGHFMRVKQDGAVLERPYCDPFPDLKEKCLLTYDEAVIELRQRLEEATSYHLVSDVEVGCFLSGGIDSTAVLALMGRHVSRPIKAFTVGFDHSAEVVDESDVAERTARKLNAEFHRVTITPEHVDDCFDDFILSLDQPSVDGLNSYLVSRETSKYVKVALSGLGGDEIFAGYPHFSWIPRISRQSKSIWDVPLRNLYQKIPNRFARNASYKAMAPSSALNKMRTISNEVQRHNMLKNAASLEQQTVHPGALSDVCQLSVAEINGYLRDTLLRDVDAISMWHSLEVRPVLLDHPLVEFALRLPDDFKVRGDRLKAIFVDSVKDLIPREVWNRKKTGFEMPFAYWMNGALRPRIISLLETNSAGMLFQSRWLKGMKAKAQSGKLQRKDWLPIVLLAWCETHGIKCAFAMTSPVQ